MRYFIVLILCIVPSLALQKDEVIQKALELEIYKQKQWLDLLHFDGKESEIDSPEFFYAKNGKKDPKAELIATIEAFYQSVDSIIVPEDFIERVSKSNALLDAAITSLPRRSSSPEDYHGICRFRARFFYLDSLLHFEGLPRLECQEFKAMFGKIAKSNGFKFREKS